MHVVFLLCLVFLHVQSASVLRGNVCTDFRSYGNIHRTKNCYYNPDLDSTPSQIADRYGFILEEHTVTTEDGYILTLFRISVKDDNSKKPKPPVILQHGILVDGRSWIISGNTSLGFILPQKGYDLWIPNFRGTSYSTKHVNPSISQKDYWNFSFHEMGIYDIPAIVEYIGRITNRNDIMYIGHSMGCSAFLVYTVVKEDHSQKYIKGIIYLAPVAYFSNPPPVIRAVLPFVNLIKTMLDSMNIYAIGNLSAIQSFFTGLTCTTYPMVVGCQMILSIASGIVVEQLRPEILPLIVKFFPTGISVNTLLHFCQIMINKGRFQYYDYGPSINMQKYNSTQPPAYELEKVKIPMQLFAGEEDLLSEIQDVHTLYDHIKAPKDLHVYKLSHLDYAYGKSVNKVYKDIIYALENSFVNNSVII